MTISFVGSSTSTAATISMPGGIASGDIAFLSDRPINSSGFPTTVVPSGWTQIGSLLTSGSTVVRLLSYKVLDGSETTITGMDGTSSNQKIMVVFRKDAGTWGTPQDIGEESNTGAPSSQTVNVGSAPLIVLANYVSNGLVSPRTFSTTADGEANVGSANYWAYKIYESSPANTTISMQDEGSFNFLASFYVALSNAAVAGNSTNAANASPLIKASRVAALSQTYVYGAAHRMPTPPGPTVRPSTDIPIVLRSPWAAVRSQFEQVSDALGTDQPPLAVRRSRIDLPLRRDYAAARNSQFAIEGITAYLTAVPTQLLIRPALGNPAIANSYYARVSQNLVKGTSISTFPAAPTPKVRSVLDIPVRSRSPWAAVHSQIQVTSDLPLYFVPLVGRGYTNLPSPRRSPWAAIFSQFANEQSPIAWHPIEGDLAATLEAFTLTSSGAIGLLSISGDLSVELDDVTLLAAQDLWTPQAAPAETWSNQTTSGDIWTVQTPAGSTWTEQD